MSKEFDLAKFDLADVVENLLSRAKNFDGDKASKANLIDPFAAALESALNGYESEAEWKETEHQRTRQKNLMNHIGDLQQSIIGKIPGWTSHPSGSGMPDVVGRRGNQLMLCEVKNKHNTMNANSSAETYDVLSEFLERPEFKGFTAGVVAVISPIKTDAFFKPFAPARRKEREDIIYMPGRVFYAIATDPQERIPFKSLQPNEKISNWESWIAIDLMMQEFWLEIEKQTNYKTPDWIKKLSEQALGAS
jgi:Holliday junction resolvase